MTPLADIALTTNAGAPASLADYAGRVVLLVNTASACGLSGQLPGLAALHHRYHDEGFAVLGFPADDFAGQEPLDDAAIAQAYPAEHGADFPLLAKGHVGGPGQHPLYRALVEALPVPVAPGGMRERLAARGRAVAEPPAVLWNYEKFLIGRDGVPVARFAPDTAPDDAGLVQVIERELFASE